MKKMRRLIPAFAMLMVAAIMLSTASFAWFTMGTHATATGMYVTATSGSSLLIVDGDGDGTIVNKFLQADSSVEFTSPTGALVPATHVGDQDTDKNKYSNLLKTVADASLVDDGDGSYDDKNGYVTTTEDTHYVEFNALIAAAGSEGLKDQDLYATVILSSDLSILLHNAVTIDFWVSTVKGTAVAYKQSVNFLTVDAVQTSADAGTTANQYKFLLAEDVDIPLALVDQDTEGSYITVTMRVYFDGALVCENDGDENNVGKTYVRNQLIDDAQAIFSVNFDVANHPVEDDAGEENT